MDYKKQKDINVIVATPRGIFREGEGNTHLHRKLPQEVIRKSGDGMRKEMTTDVIDKIDNNNMKALEMIKAIEKVAECDEIVIDGVDVLMMINVVHDYLKDNYRIFDDCK